MLTKSRKDDDESQMQPWTIMKPLSPDLTPVSVLQMAAPVRKG